MIYMSEEKHCVVCKHPSTRYSAVQPFRDCPHCEQGMHERCCRRVFREAEESGKTGIQCKGCDGDVTDLVEGVVGKSLTPDKKDLASKCPVCFEECVEQDMETTRCGHNFCKECIETWKGMERGARSEANCPLCRGTIGGGKRKRRSKRRKSKKRKSRKRSKNRTYRR